MKIIIAIIIFSAIILFHELGHFLLAKKNKIVVTEFSLGMGPRLLSTERNGTRYSLKLLPIGGSCAMLGEDTDEEDEPGTFNSAPVGGRIAVVAAGPVFNFIMAFVLSVIIVGVVGYEPSTVLSVKEGSAAEAAGLKEGDVITSYQGYHVDLGKDIYVYSYMNELKEGDTVRLTVKRDGEKKEISYQSDTNVRYLLGCNFKGDDTTAMTVEYVMEGMPLDDAGVKEGCDHFHQWCEDRECPGLSGLHQGEPSDRRSGRTDIHQGRPGISCIHHSEGVQDCRFRIYL